MRKNHTEKKKNPPYALQGADVYGRMKRIIIHIKLSRDFSLSVAHQKPMKIRVSKGLITVYTSDARVQSDVRRGSTHYSKIIILSLMLSSKRFTLHHQQVAWRAIWTPLMQGNELTESVWVCDVSFRGGVTTAFI